MEKVKAMIPRMEKTVSELKHELDLEDLKFVRMGESGKGLDGFEPHQRDAAVMCRSIVNEVVEKALDSYLRQQLPTKQRQYFTEETLAVTRELNELQKANMKQRVCGLIRDEMILELTSEMSVDVIDEFFEVCKLATAKGSQSSFSQVF